MSTPEYAAWQAQPTPENLGRVLNSLDPIINSEIRRYSGPSSLLRMRARQLALNAVRTYNPAHGAQLGSWIVTQLQPLSRYGQSLKPVYVPEVATRQGAELNRLRTELSDELGRDATDEELADQSGISVSRIKSLKTKMRPSVSESVMTRVEDDNVSHAPATIMPDRVGMAEEIVVSSLPDVDRQIHELKTGRKGEPMQNKDIASMLKISPARVSQRSKTIADQINMLITKGWV